MACPKTFTSMVFLLVMEDTYGIHDYSFHGYRAEMKRNDKVTIRCKRCKEIFRRPANRLMRGRIRHTCKGD